MTISFNSIRLLNNYLLSLVQGLVWKWRHIWLNCLQTELACWNKFWRQNLFVSGQFSPNQSAEWEKGSDLDSIEGFSRIMKILSICCEILIFINTQYVRTTIIINYMHIAWYISPTPIKIIFPPDVRDVCTIFNAELGELSGFLGEKYPSFFPPDNKK